MSISGLPYGRGCCRHMLGGECQLAGWLLHKIECGEQVMLLQKEIIDDLLALVPESEEKLEHVTECINEMAQIRTEMG